jgi:hypothetical protein
VSDLDVKDHTAMDEILDDVKYYNTNRSLLLYKIIVLFTIAKVQILNKPYIHCIDINPLPHCPFCPPCPTALGLIELRKKEKKLVLMTSARPSVETHCYSSLPPPSPSGFPVFIFNLCCL